MKGLKPLIIFTLICIYTPIFAQKTNVIASGIVKNKATLKPISYANVILKNEKDSSFVSGTITNEEGRFTLLNLKEGKYVIEVSFLGFVKSKQPLFIGSLSDYLDLKTIELEENKTQLNDVIINGKQEEIAQKLDKKTFTLADNIAQSGGSVLQSMQNLPGVTVQDGKVQLRGNDKIMVLIDGKQTALTGFGNQTSLDNIPASSIEKIEIINNPSAKFDANGNAGIINIIYKKNKQEGFNGKVGLVGGLGALFVKNSNYPTSRAQFQNTPKFNPSLSLNYKKKSFNLFFQGDYLYTQTLNKNEFVERTYDDGTVIKQQTKRNRTTTVGTAKVGFDWNLNAKNSLTVAGLFSSEKIIDNGDQPFFNKDFSERTRLWQFLEDELKTTATTTASFQHKFTEPGHLLNIGFNYTFHREDEKYFFTNIMPTYTGFDAFKLLSDEHVFDINLDYTKPLKYGKIEGGIKVRRRSIPTNMLFIPGLNSPLDTNAGGWANYDELIPALYGNYVLENNQFELEAGLRLEYVDLQYQVNPNHNTYKSNGYNYTQPFPNVRLAYKLNDNNKFSFFYNRRVDRPNEVDIRIFPKYDDAEIVKIGNPALRPQFTNSFELGYKTNLKKGYFYTALYLKLAEATIARIASVAPNSNLIYSIMQNAGKSNTAGIEMVFSKTSNKWFAYNININAYQNTFDAFTVVNKYPTENKYAAASQSIFSGNAKWNGIFHLPKKIDVQLTAIYLAPDIIPQGKMGTRFSLDLGAKKTIQKGKGEVFLNATDLLNTLVIIKEVNGSGFNYTSRDYYETQVIRIGYNYKF
jgi:outer membrane receptor protein involved in Fe transport